ncbi:hypothetical protein MAP00_008467 [Monascus purpureus]|nr:hypothetical protein MAP00_008467 [Monascus purpureus]
MQHTYDSINTPYCKSTVSPLSIQSRPIHPQRAYVNVNDNDNGRGHDQANAETNSNLKPTRRLTSLLGQDNLLQTSTHHCRPDRSTMKPLTSLSRLSALADSTVQPAPLLDHWLFRLGRGFRLISG